MTRRIVIPGEYLDDFDNAEDLELLHDPRIERALAGERVLFLDDSHRRWRTFRSRYPHADRVETALDAINALQSRTYRVVCLDHDLNGEHFVDSRRPDTGMEVVRFIVKRRPVIGLVIVHTNFAEAGREMRRQLRAAGYDTVYWPFGWDWLSDD